MRNLIGPAAQLARLLDAETFAHTLRVASLLTRDADIVVALLHDVVEDTELNFADVRRELTGQGATVESVNTVIEALSAVTRINGETYAEFIERAAKNEIGRRVKLADVEDHLAQTETLKPSLKPRYEKALQVLQAPEEKEGHAVLQASAEGVILSSEGDEVVVPWSKAFNERLAAALASNNIVSVTCGSSVDFPAASGVPAGYRNLHHRIEAAFNLIDGYGE